MAVDGIGKRGNVLPAEVGASQGAAPPEAARLDEAFAVEGAEGVAPLDTSALDRLRSGEITLDQYLDARVEGAVQHLEGRLSTAETDFVKQVLRDQLTSDPVLVELIGRATGGARVR